MDYKGVAWNLQEQKSGGGARNKSVLYRGIKIKLYGTETRFAIGLEPIQYTEFQGASTWFDTLKHCKTIQTTNEVLKL